MTPNYWDKRALRRLTEAEKLSEEHIEQIKRIYEQAYRDISKEIERTYKAYSKNTGLDIEKLKELLTKKETDKVWKTLKRQGLDKYIKNNYKSRISRLEQIQAQIYAKAKLIYPKEELQNTMCYKGVINDSYYKAVYDTQMGTGYDFSFTKIDNNMTQLLLNENWSGLNYSDRIWKNTDYLADSLSRTLGGAMLSGQSIDKTTQQIRERFRVSKYYAERLVRTETNHFHNEADAMAYEQMGVKKYVFVATLDNRTSDICQSHDNKVYNFKDKQTGVNYPPLHPNCRSKTRGYINAEVEKTLKRKARNPVTGKTEYIDNMSYKDWIKQQKIKYGNTAVDNSFKRVRNKSTDKEQYSRYHERLKNSPFLPKNIEEFTNLKYNRASSYKKLSREYRTIGKLNKSSDNLARDISTYYEFRKFNIEMSDHAIYGYHNRMYKKDGSLNYNFDIIREIAKKKANYFDSKTNRYVNFYDNISIIKEKDTGEMVTIRKSRLNKKWKEL